MAQRDFPRGSTCGTGSGGASGRYIERNPIRTVTQDQTTEARLREEQQRRAAQNPTPTNKEGR